MKLMRAVEVGTGMVLLMMTWLLRNIVGMVPRLMELMRFVEIETGMVNLLMTLALINVVGVMPL